MFKAANILSFLLVVSQLWIVAGMKGLILAVSVACSTAPRTSLGCSWICCTFALKQTWIGLSRLGSLNNLASSSTTCMWSGTVGVGPARGNGLASVIVARVLRGGKISGLITVVVWISCGTIRFRCFRSPSSSPTCLLSGTIGIVPARGNGSASAIRAVLSHDDKRSSLICTLLHLLGGTVHFRRFKWLGPFRSNRIAGPTCPDKEVWILAMLYVMFYVVISKISVCLFACLVVTT